MELFKLFGTIALDNSSANEGIDETTSKAEESHSRISTAFSKIGDAAVVAGKAIMTGLAAGATAIGVLLKQSIDSYAEYEQLVGGVDTLFGGQSLTDYVKQAKEAGMTAMEALKAYEEMQTGAEIVMENAANAYKTAGMSANDYMSTVTSFSAALIQSLGGDTVAAADKANLAITDMSDNANKMGSDISMIQNAYQGFAKQNYTMLDNLKLGYGGTKEEMERLLEDAEKLSGIEYDLSSYSDIVDAIHVIQTEMGITGTTAKEADATIQGSLASTKAAWQNLLTGFADDSQDVGALITNVVNSATNVINNLMPRIKNALNGITSFVKQLSPIIAEELPAMLEEILPGLIEGATALIESLVEALPELLESLLPVIVEATVSIASSLVGMLPELVNLVFNDLPYLIADALSGSSNTIVSSVGDAFLNLGEYWREIILPAINGIVEAFKPLVDAVQPILSIFPSLITESTGLTSVWDALREGCYLIEGALQVVADKVTALASWISQHSEEIKSVIQGLWDAVQLIWDNFGQPVFDVIMSVVSTLRDTFGQMMPEIKEFVSNCFDDISTFWNTKLKPVIQAIGDFIQTYLAPAFEAVFNSAIVGFVRNAFDTIQGLWNNTLKPIFNGIIDFITGVFSGNWEQAWNGIVEVFKGIFNLIPQAIETVLNNAINLINGLIEGINTVSEAIGLGSINLIPHVSLPRLEEGGILEKGQVGLLEGTGAEAVVPLDQNRAWISAVAADMADAGIGGGNNAEIRELKEAFADFVQVLPEMLIDAFASMKFDVNNREFARLVKAVN